ncbi:Bifunctional methylenetetrahydrofolate dehydrogenase/cyclohydrolase, mitochondrial [Lonchura striata]|uniref:Bifunctional methylenetetrahydrofolate dehydrogenase/cyclohydrolase, mitochondrial n=1 Tax=Lonchura striata TaxID=40157 RepID=A0A218U9U7_9PASE|nr:Bifunctional methylenetetrahydrofolate dehydrogenase/cyclohydrolase, mitochondrial [Lonchura striata domestica]
MLEPSLRRAAGVPEAGRAPGPEPFPPAVLHPGGAGGAEPFLLQGRRRGDLGEETGPADPAGSAARGAALGGRRQQETPPERGAGGGEPGQPLLRPQQNQSGGGCGDQQRDHPQASLHQRGGAAGADHQTQQRRGRGRAPGAASPAWSHPGIPGRSPDTPKSHPGIPGRSPDTPKSHPGIPGRSPGIPNLITADMVKEGAAVIDVGLTRVQDPLTAQPRLVGDVDFEGVRKKASYITPVPGGVGPMTVAMLMKNTIIAAKKRHGALNGAGFSEGSL